MKKLNPEYLNTVINRVNTCPYFDLLSINVKTLDWGRSHMEVEVREKHLQPFGMVHGGVFSSIIDAASFWAVWPQVEEGIGMTTVEMKLNYLAPASDGMLIAKGKSIKVGKTLCLAEASVKNEEGKLLAHGTSTMMVLKDWEIQGQGALPAKFLEK